MSRWKLVGLASLALAQGAGCHREVPAPPSWPAGTVLVLDGQPISAAEVDEVGSWIAMLEPRDSLEQLRRLALTNVLFPRCAAANLDPDARREARALAERWKGELARGVDLTGPVPGPQLQERSGRMLELGMEVWNAAQALPIGQWSDLIETAGCFHLVRPKVKGEGKMPGEIQLTVQIYDFPYLPQGQERQSISAALDSAHIVYVDPAWRAFVPLAWQSRLREGTP